MNYFNNFFDGFFLAAATVVIILTFIDFLLGEARRQAMRDGMADWWLHLQEMTFSGLVAEDARVVIRFFHKVFSKKWFSETCFFKAGLISLIFLMITILVMNFLFLFFDLRGESYVPFMLEFWHMMAFVAPINAVFDWVSLGATIYFLGIIAKSADRLGVLAAVVITDIFVAIILGVAVIISTSVVLFFVFGDLSWNLAMVLTWGGVVITCLIPTFVHVVYSATFLASKLFQPLIQKPLSVLILRFSESSKGPLTLIAIGLGTVAKFGQQGVKFF